MEGGGVRRRIRIYDCRSGKEEKVVVKLLETSGLDFNGFLLLLQGEFGIRSHETFVLATTDRTVLDFDNFAKLQDDTTLHMLQQEGQALPMATEERINFQPHYNTLIQCGTYEYYASAGKKSLPYALAELIDNSLSATAKNTGARTIEIRMVFDETLGKPALIVLDNGCGMTCKQLNNWAVYRLSKYSRENSTLSKQEGYVRPDPVPRSLNSDISYFGVGGKQAVFYIGDSARMISKPVGSPDVHELILSKEDFKRKEMNKEDIYSGTIRNRKPGNSSHVTKDERFLHTLIAEEPGKESFTAVVITGILPEHITFLKQDFEVWTRQLANIYHYYIHGANGKDLRSSSANSDNLPKIDIQITLREKPPRCPRAMNLREVDNDMQTLFVSSAADTFEFQACEQGGGTVEGIIRYHPFLYDKETYPKDPDAVQVSCDDDDDYDNDSGTLARGEKSIFHCFWNGRLIPYTTVSEFDWCAPSKGAKDLAECYSRISGVLFSDDRFQVSTNKLTFMELELKLKDKDTIFTRVVNGQKQRSNIQKDFTQWLKNCHIKWDKQVKFLGYMETITRTDVPTKKMQYPWATFSSIEWDGKTYKTGQLVKSHKTLPILYGKVVRFLLYGKHDGDVYATGGQVEVTLEPRAYHDKIKTIAISKIDKTATLEAIKKNISNDAAKLPEILKVDWPDGNLWPQDAVHPAGTPLGPLQVEILNRNGESLSKMPAVGQGAGKKLAMRLTVVLHGPQGDQDVFACPLAHFSSKWGFWFNSIDTLTHLGNYTLTVQTVINESHATAFGGRELPSYKLKFTIREGPAESFVISPVSSTLRVGVPFDIPLLIKDAFDHLTTPPPDLKPLLKCSDLGVTYEAVDNSGTTFIIKSVKASGKVLNYQQSKTYDLKVTLPGLKKNTQTVKISLLPGNPHSLHVTPEDNVVTVENGKSVSFDVEVHDEAGNITAHPKQMVRCQIVGFPPVSTDCSTTGAGQLVTSPINLKIIDGEPEDIKVQFEMPNQKTIAMVTRTLKVVPSTRVSHMELCSDSLVLRNNEKIEWLAGGVLQNLLYKLYDEAGREVPPTAEIASMIKVNWTADVYVQNLLQRKLPDLHVPTQVQETRFYQVSYKDQSVSVSFSIVPRPDEPARLKATLLQSTVKLGKALPGNISLELVDQYDNATKTLTSTSVKHVTVEAEGLDKSAVVFKWQESSKSVLVTGVHFLSGIPGPREMCFTYGTFVERVIVKVTAGEPAQLKLLSGPEQPLQLLNDQGLATPFLLQLCDEWGNPSTDQRVVVGLKSSPPTLQVKTAVTSQPVNAEGKASFTVTSLSGPKGYYQLLFYGSLNNKPIPGPAVNLTVIPDPNKPVSLSVKYNNNARFPAGGTFPVFSVTVVSDEGSPILTFNPAAVSMLLWKGEPLGKAPPQTVTEMKCSKPMENEKEDCFHFRDKEIPEHVGKYTIQFSLRRNKDKDLFSSQILINVVANQPVKLGPDSQPPTPVVSYSKAIANRTLVENMTLRITDSHGNPTGQDLEGKVVLSIKNSTGHRSNSLPLFEGKANSLTMSLEGGKAHITRLAIVENSPGENGRTYILIFKPEVPMFPFLTPFELPFHFYNDAENQQKMAELSRKKDKLMADVAKYQDVFATHTELYKMLTNLHKDTCKKVDYHRSELIKRNIQVEPTIADIDRLIREKNTEVSRILQTPRRVFTTSDPFKGQQDVLGMVGHLAFVEDDDAAWVISWHIRGDMDCVITRTAAAARRIYDVTQGRQQVLALDRVYVQSANRPMPHIRNGHMLFNPPGNPVFARDLLICPFDPKSCSIAFINLLGDTILIDDMDSADAYRGAVIQNKMQCPTILTRQGDRMNSRGKYGGAQNKAPPMNTFPMFGAPLPPQCITLQNHIEVLTQYRAALDKREKLKKDCDDHDMKSPEVLRNQEELKEKKEQLKEIERQLVSVRPVKRGFGDAGEPSSVFPKRTKQ